MTASTVSLTTHRAPDQKYYDAMLIRAWRRFMPSKRFSIWVREEFGVWPNELPLRRCGFFFGKRGMRVVIAEHMPSLNERLYRCETDSDFIATLTWLQHQPNEQRDTRVLDFGREPTRGLYYTRKKMQGHSAISAFTEPLRRRGVNPHMVQTRGRTK